MQKNSDEQYGCVCEEAAKDLSHIAPGYRRALWIVVVLNVGYGLIEIVAGFVGKSQALKADALDFLGDGLITWLGLLAIGWSVGWRAKSALIQGIFLAALGLGVLGTTIYRVFVLNEPEAGVMGAVGAVALVVNVAAAVVLIPHRAGDANVRAVWLFSRNDAIGNVAVEVAAGLVAWTGRPWPDLVVAAIIAALFLHSSWSIVRDARGDIRIAQENKVENNPKGGRLLEQTEPKAEFFLEKDHTATITFYDAALKPVPAAAQSVTVIADAEGGKKTVEFEKKGDVLVSKTKLPEGDGYNLVVQFKPMAEAKPQNFRFKLETHTCGGCQRAEYACTCDE